MKKLLTIAAREYRAMVGTKAFLFSLIMMPLLMSGSILAMQLLKNVGEVKEHRIVVIDHTGKLFTQLKLAADEYNKRFDAPADEQTQNQEGTPSESDDGEAPDNDRKEGSADSEEKSSREEMREDMLGKGAKYLLEQWEEDEFTDEDRLELSNQVRRQELYAFIEIPPEIMSESIELTANELVKLPKVRFYSEESSFSDARRFMQVSVNELVKAWRMQQLGLPAAKVANASIPVTVEGLGLTQQSASGEIVDAEVKNELVALFLPMGVMMLMFMVIFLASQPMLESVLEEKSQRIAEVLLGSANPFQLMLGKLFGTVAGSLTIFGIYLIGGFALASYNGWTDYIPFNLVPWFIVFQVTGVLFFASIFMAVGASVTQLKEAQSMLLPVWVLLMSPMFVWFLIVREPNGSLATGFSMFPPAVSTTMMLRMSTGATIPIWQPMVGLIILIASTIFVIYIASRIFRVGLLWQGKTPKLSELIKWAFRG